MLDPEYLNSLPEPIIKLYEQLEDWIIKDIARRIKKAGEVTAAAEHQTDILRALDLSTDEINKKIAETLNQSEDEIERLFNEAYERSKNFTEERLPTLPTDGSFKKELLENAIKTAQGDIENLTRTAGYIQNKNGIQNLGLTQAYRQTLTSAALKVSTGATDYNTSIRDALRPFTERGLVNIYYDKDGKIRRRSIESAVRQCVMQGARDMSKAYMQDVANEVGADGWEISAHLNCAPDHQNVQGRQYSNERFQRMNEKLARPIGTLNCRHMAFPIILGVSEPAHTKQQLYDLKAANDKGVTYEGKHYTLYEAAQQQRKLERTIRKTKRELIVSEQLQDKDAFTAQSIRLRRLREYYKDFSNQCKLTKRPELMTIGNSRKNKFSKSTNTSIINSEIMSRNSGGSSFEPMDKERFERIKKGCAKVGISIIQDEEAQRNLDFFGNEAAAINAYTILLRPNPTASAVFEEIIHATQYRNGKLDGSYESRLKCEIEAARKLIRCKKSYGITDEEDIETRRNLEYYIGEYKRLKGDLDV